jgi:pyruvate/2-oxoglutarate dehydrogenase complex dihydrolipoamide acyltransferase (E2) component
MAAEADQESAAAKAAAKPAEDKESEPAVAGTDDDTKAEAAQQAASAEAPEPTQDGAASEESGGEHGEAPSTGSNGHDAGGRDTSKRGIISPLVRKLADEHAVDLSEVDGTGTGGRIRKQDVLKHVETRKARPAARSGSSAEPAPEREAERDAAPAAAAAREESVPWSNIRRLTAEHMVASHLETARAWNAVEADWTHVVDLRTKAKEAFKAKEGFNLTYMPFLARAVCDTLLEMPEVNATYDAENHANIVKHYVNLGIAVALDGGGLIVPVIKGADEKNLVGVARAINDVATRSRTKKLSPDDLTGGTFTITNPGPFGSVMSVPIIPRGQTAILAFEAIKKRVVVVDDEAIAIRSMGFLPMSWDHRTIDGAEAAKFLARLRERIETTDWSTELGQYL